MKPTSSTLLLVLCALLATGACGPRGGGSSVAIEQAQAEVQLATTLGMQTIAEGVEEPVELEVLNQAGCRMIQGYLVARPMSMARLQPFLDGWGGTQRPQPTDLPETMQAPLDALPRAASAGR